ncbi:MAG: 30S ribosome-binding factor RbfA [bacterium]|nr:30S ribosome-binding factor RbfA [bacterium]
MKRLESVNHIIQEEIARAIDREVEFPEGVLVTITRVDTSEDKFHAKVFFSILGSTDEGGIAAILGQRTAVIQKILNERLRVRPIPKIRFLIDEHEKRREKIEEILGDTGAETDIASTEEAGDENNS